MKKLHKSATRIIPRFVKSVVPTTAIAGLLSQPSFAAPGDLDPTFGDVGRASFPLSGAAANQGRKRAVDPDPPALLLVFDGENGAVGEDADPQAPRVAEVP